jgi:hypothetical protein
MIREQAPPVPGRSFGAICLTPFRPRKTSQWVIEIKVGSPLLVRRNWFESTDERTLSDLLGHGVG